MRRKAEVIQRGKLPLGEYGRDEESLFLRDIEGRVECIRAFGRRRTKPRSFGKDKKDEESAAVKGKSAYSAPSLSRVLHPLSYKAAP